MGYRQMTLDDIIIAQDPGFIPEARVRLVRERPVGPIITSTEEATQYVAGMIACEPSEHAVVLALDNHLQVLGYKTIGIGSINACIVDVRSVMQYLLLENANHFILFHNHPSGDPAPSQEDNAITKQLKTAGEIMSIRMLDHVIVGTETKTYSYRIETNMFR